MVRCRLAVVFAVATLTWSGAQLAAQTRVACLGDSITFGAQLDDREHTCYPALLGAGLGSGYDVQNFGVGGATLLRRGDKPYLDSDRCKAAIAWAPQIAVIVLGTNDTTATAARPNWEHAGELEADAQVLIAALHAARPDVRVLLACPPPMFPEQPGLAPARRDDLRERLPRLEQVTAAVRRVAASTPGVEYLELGHAFPEAQVSDGVHPTPFGSEALARRVMEAIESPPMPALGLEALLTQRGVPTDHEDFHGFTTLCFALPHTGAACRIVQPRNTARVAPWILRARFFGHQPELDLGLLERGFHVVYCDVADLFGAPAALERWDEFYQLLRALGLREKGVLEGMSRGGLPIVNWAAAHPDRVAAIYGDNPVADFRSWPGGHTGQRSDEDWQHCLAAYGLSESEAANYHQMPIDRVAKVAAAHIPLLLVLGTADDVVPPAENGELLATRCRDAGGPVEVWRKPGLGHHPHGLDPVEPLLRAVLRASRFEAMPSVRAMPSVEYRKGAGWKGSWWSEVESMRTLAGAQPETQLVFFGDSITQGLTGADDRIAHAGGARAIDQAFGERHALSLGLSGDRTEHLLYRIEHGALASLRPKVIVLQIGVNNVHTAGHTATETAAGIAAVVRSLAVHQPQAKVVLCGPFPLGLAGEPQRQAIDDVHRLIQPMGDDRRVFYRDLRALFVDADGAPNANMSDDHVHITRSGQDAWMRAIKPLVDELLR